MPATISTFRIQILIAGICKFIRNTHDTENSLRTIFSSYLEQLFITLISVSAIKLIAA